MPSPINKLIKRQKEDGCLESLGAAWPRANFRQGDCDFPCSLLTESGIIRPRHNGRAIAGMDESPGHPRVSLVIVVDDEVGEEKDSRHQKPVRPGKKVLKW